MKKDIDISLSRPGHRRYNKIDYTEGEDVFLNIDLSTIDTAWKDEAYNLTIYDKDRNTIYSDNFTKDAFTIKLNDLDVPAGSRTGEMVIEDRTDMDNIDVIQVIAYLVFVQFPGSTPTREVSGSVDYENADGSITQIPIYSET